MPCLHMHGALHAWPAARVACLIRPSLAFPADGGGADHNQLHRSPAGIQQRPAFDLQQAVRTGSHFERGGGPRAMLLASCC
jgi:hypothetical protein